MTVLIKSRYDISASQHGVITKGQLDQSGTTRAQRRTLMASGALEVVGSGVYRLAGSPRSPEQGVLIACLDARAVASHRTAAGLHGLDGFHLDRPIEVMVRAGRHNARSEKARIHTTNWLPSNDLTTVRAVPATSVARTLFSLAALVPELTVDRVRGAVDDAVAKGLATEKWLWWQLERTRRRGRNGVRVLEGVLTERSAGAATESWLERTTLQVIADADLPLPVCQRRIAPEGAFVARVDFLYPDQMVVIEVLGYRWHRTREQMAADAERRRRLTLLGYEVHEFTYDEIVCTPEKLVGLVQVVLNRPPRPA